jgi:hypothetical protein
MRKEDVIKKMIGLDINEISNLLMIGKEVEKIVKECPFSPLYDGEVEEYLLDCLEAKGFTLPYKY